jgi:hypothetical protein
MCPPTMEEFKEAPPVLDGVEDGCVAVSDVDDKERDDDEEEEDEDLLKLGGSTEGEPEPEEEEEEPESDPVVPIIGEKRGFGFMEGDANVCSPTVFPDVDDPRPPVPAPVAKEEEEEEEVNV